MLFVQSIKALIVMLVLSVIIAEARPKGPPQEVQEIIYEELPPLEDDVHIDADSFPLAPDIEHIHQDNRVGGIQDYHIRK